MLWVEGTFYFVRSFSHAQLRIKIQAKRRNSALIQYAHPMQAELAQQYLNGAPLFGNTLRVEPSKFTFVMMPRDGDTESTSLAKYVEACMSDYLIHPPVDIFIPPIYRDFTDCRRHRFLSLDAQLYQFLAPPNPVSCMSVFIVFGTCNPDTGVFSYSLSGNTEC
eukprot:gb/GECG01002091.1/.p1 GENE.gb/GECG01002091.1/~~gb/GECG01002091.1/.p1  ORF type:complete len:164 (+),score=8.57 gb/GECG01002091.1/:1-492(+)